MFGMGVNFSAKHRIWYRSIFSIKWVYTDIPLEAINDTIEICAKVLEDHGNELILDNTNIDILGEYYDNGLSIVEFYDKHNQEEFIIVWNSKELDFRTEFDLNFKNTNSSYSKSIIMTFQKFGIARKVNQSEYTKVVDRLYDMTWKGHKAEFVGELDYLLGKYFSMTGKQKPGFM